MLSVEDVQERILAGIFAKETETTPILDAGGRVLAEDIIADMSVPPWDNSAMDGFAVQAADIEKAGPSSPVILRVIGNLPAGTAPDRAVGSGEAIRIMTGAPVPPGADTVVRFEDTRSDGDSVEILEAIPMGKNVRRAGEDVQQGELVLRAGMLLRPQEIGMLAVAGRQSVAVIQRPTVALLATGDEVVDAGEPVPPGKIRNINSYTNAAQVRRHGGIPMMLGIVPDDAERIRSTIRRAIADGADILVTSGGVSVGDYDFVKQILAEEGEVEFWWINMKPGKPMAFGRIGGIPFFGLPGNPVSAMISFELFVRPAIDKMQGREPRPTRSVRARLLDPIPRKDNRRHYLRVRLTAVGDGWEASLTGSQGSGILSSLVEADGLAVIPESKSSLEAGTEVEVLWLD
ncbi:molybdopterin molybdotransferase MoeA [Candidatus Bipolaricaulota bacterium]|nr:molybdopterin molybdotransferase MoeA [Candidatus Bipolaricaulota bacterium]